MQGEHNRRRRRGDAPPFLLSLPLCSALPGQGWNATAPCRRQSRPSTFPPCSPSRGTSVRPPPLPPHHLAVSPLKSSPISTCPLEQDTCTERCAKLRTSSSRTRSTSSSRRATPGSRSRASTRPLSASSPSKLAAALARDQEEAAARQRRSASSFTTRPTSPRTASRRCALSSRSASRHLL